MHVDGCESTGSDNNIQSYYVTVTTVMRDWQGNAWNRDYKCR